MASGLQVFFKFSFRWIQTAGIYSVRNQEAGAAPPNWGQIKLGTHTARDLGSSLLTDGYQIQWL